MLIYFSWRQHKLSKNSFFRECFQGLAHVWRVTAYYMGMEDDANLVKDDWNRTRDLLMDIGHFIIIPAVLQLNATSLIMGKNVARANRLDYHVIFYLALEGYGVPLFRLWAAFGWTQKLLYYWNKLLMGTLLYSNVFRWVFNTLLRWVINYNIKITRQQYNDKK